MTTDGEPAAPSFLDRLFGLDGRVALVTGASGGIGRGLAAGLSSAGATIALSGRDTTKLDVEVKAVQASGGSAAAFPADIEKLDSVRALVDATMREFGRIDILVNCAGMNRRQPIVDVTSETYDEIMNVNLKSAYFLSQAVAPIMARQGGGKIIHIGSINAAIGLSGVSVYGLSKSALVQTTKVMAIEWAEDNIQVNALCPGFIKTELTEPLWNDPGRSGWIMDRLSIKRPGTPEDLIGMAIYLASQASNYTTGQAFYVDGGMLAGSPW